MRLLFFRNILVFFIVFVCACAEKPDVQPVWPEITSQTKPWTRWWWHGSAVTKEGITAELEAYKKAGLGGVEITPIYGVYGGEKEFIDYLSPQWMDMLIYTLEEALRLGLGVDMATGTGWPFGGPWIDHSNACKNIVYKTYQLSSGERLQEPVRHSQEPLLRVIGNQVYELHGSIYKVPNQKPQGSMESPLLNKDVKTIKIKDITDPVEQNENLQALAIDQVRFDRLLPLKALIAYSSDGNVVNLTEKVAKNGNLDWTAPNGDWTLYAVFQGWHGKMVERAAPGGEGNVIDHFSQKAIDHYLSKFDSAFSGRNIQSLRAFFNDSYEVDDAHGSADYTPQLFEEFKNRRGYDLLHYLPALFGNDAEEKNERVLCDYRETISEMIHENFTSKWKKWAHEKEAIVRNQAHGSPANILDLYEEVDIPEMEGTDVLRIKMASSAANISGKPLTSSESATWLNEHFLSNLSDIKVSLDRFMLSGVNHIFYHGTTYSPASEPWPGRLFYAAVHVNPRNPLWDDFGKLNSYVARCQSFLQNSTSDNDILLYFPIYDRFSTPGRELIEHFDGVDAQFDGTAFKEAAEFMVANGYAFDYISDRQLSNTSFQNGELKTSGGSYKTILVPQCDYIPLETFEKLTHLSREGATIVYFKGLPKDVAGWSDLDHKKKSFDTLLSEMDSGQAGNDGISESVMGKGKILTGESLEVLLAKTAVRKEEIADNIPFIRKKTSNGALYFLANQNEKKFDGWVTLNTQARSAFLFNPMNGLSGKAFVKTNSDKTQVYVQLDPQETIVVEAYFGNASGDMYPFYKAQEKAVTINGDWQIRFVSGGPELPADITTNSLKSWTEFEGDLVKNFSGTAIYTLQFARPSATAEFWELDLGKVHESAEVSLNGEVIDTLIGPAYNVVFAQNVLQDQNELQVKVSNLMANRIAYLDKNDVFWKKFYNVNFPARLAANRKGSLFDASGWEPLRSGLTEDVRLIPVETIQPD